ncbi:MAG: hypothetical protein ACLUNZ_05285 [Evtepia sp.]
MPYKLSHPEYLTLTGPGGTRYRGGDQEWYHDLWQRRAGCRPHHSGGAAVPSRLQAHPVLAPMAPGEAHAQAKGFLAYMEAVWPYVTPGSRGLDSPENMVPGCRKLCPEPGLLSQGRGPAHCPPPPAALLRPMPGVSGPGFGAGLPRGLFELFQRRPEKSGQLALGPPHLHDGGGARPALHDPGRRGGAGHRPGPLAGHNIFGRRSCDALAGPGRGTSP